MEGHSKDAAFEERIQRYQQYLLFDDQDHQNLQHPFDQLFSNNEQMVLFGEDQFAAAALGNDQANGSRPAKEQQNGNQHSSLRKKSHNRLTKSQLERLEEYLLECPHPDDKERKDLSIELGVDPLRIKFWFQNKRHKLKTQNDKATNQMLKEENSRLVAENLQLKEALRNVLCANCSGKASSQHQLCVENAHLNDQIERMTAIGANYNSAQQMTAHPNWSAGSTSNASDEFGF